MGQRLQLNQILKNLLGSDYVYFQPPASLKIEHPCVIYRRTNIDTIFANDNPYVTNKQYQITVVDANPDSLIPDKIGKLPKCLFDRHFTADSFNHDVYNIYF